MSFKPRPLRQRPKPRPRSRPRLFMPAPLPQTSLKAHWSPQQMPLEELLLDYQLPQLVQCRTPVLRSSSHDDHVPPPVRLDHPIILAEKRSAHHLLAKVVSYDQRTGSFNESPDSVVIPEDYDGHFLRLQSRTTKDKSHVRTLQSIAQDDTPAFLNLANITSFPVEPRDALSHSKLIYTVGNVFLVDEPLPDSDNYSWKQSEKENGKSTANSGRSKPKSEISGVSSKRSTNGMMRCLDERGLPVMVPTNQAGDMVTVQKSGQASKLSVKSSDMIANEQFPLLARFAYSKNYPRLTAFSKLLTLLDSFHEDSIIACTLDGASMTLLEIPVTSSLQFQVALNREELLSAPRLRSALEMCRTRGQELARDIKFKYKFAHRVQETSRRMMKLKESDVNELPSATMRTRLVVTETYVYI